jgi:hypothetical protein
MTEPSDLARHLFDQVTTTGTLDLGTWCDFEAEHGVEAQQIEPLLVEVIGHVLTLAGELQREVGSLSHALSRRCGP